MFFILEWKKGSVSPGFCVSFRVPLTRDVVTIYSKWRARLQAKLWREYSVRNGRETFVTLKSMIDKNRKNPRRKSRKIRDTLVSLENTQETHAGRR